MNHHNCHKIFELLAANNSLPKTELNYSTPFQLLIAAVFSAQSTDIGVNRITQQLFLDAPTPKAMLALGNEKLTQAIHSLGLYRNKAKNAIGICQALIEKYNGKVPSSREALESLPGVGRKTANIILNIIFEQPVIAVDTHVFRVANRTKIACGEQVKVVEDSLMKAVPLQFRQYAHHWLVLHGRYICKAKKPNCKTCIIAKYCEYPNKNVS